MQRGHTGGKQETRLPTVKTEVKAEDDFCGDNYINSRHAEL